MEKEFVPYEIELAMKDLGYNGLCLNYYSFWGNGEVHLQERPVRCNKISIDDNVLAPLYQQVFKWFTFTHRLNGSVRIGTSGLYKYEIWKWLGDAKGWESSNSQSGYEKPEQAELACLKKLIEIVKK